MDHIKKYSKLFLLWFVSLFRQRYKVTVSFNKEYGDSDDRTFVTKKNFSAKRKTLKV